MVFVLLSIILSASTASRNLSQAEIEIAFWDCEFAATQGVLELSEAAACSRIYEYLKKAKFLGDFDRFLVWWQENRDRELSSRMKSTQLPLAQ